MTEKQYKTFEHFLMAVVFAVTSIVIFALLLGVYALADLVF